MKRYNMSAIMSKAWELFRKYEIAFAEALHRAWNVAKSADENAHRIEVAKAEAGVEEEVNTWAGWKALGFEVIHGMKALFSCELIYASKGDGKIYKASFFGASEVARVAA